MARRHASGAPQVTRDVMTTMAPGALADVLDGADRLLRPLSRLLGRVDYGALDGRAPPVVFDPVTAAGGRVWHDIGLSAAPAPAQPALPGKNELAWMPATDLAALVSNGRLGAARVAAVCAERIRALDPLIGAFITVTIGRQKPAAGRHRPDGPLAGVPIGLKDLIDVAGVRTTCGSRVSPSRIPVRDAACWQRLEAAGAVLAGKLGTHEFAAGVTCEDTPFGTIRNPWDTAHMSGGSSGGSAAAVAAGMVPVALGTDTGGSVRIPAACCGVVGFKPTFDLVPTGGIQPLAWSLDHAGPIARNVRDAALILDVLAGTRCEPTARSGARHGVRGMRVGVPVKWLGRVTTRVRSAFGAALEDLRHVGAEIVDVDGLPDPGELALVNRVIAYAEGSACHEQLLRSGAPFGEPILPRLQAGRFLLAGEYLAAQRLRAAACRSFAKVWAAADVLATPTLPCTAPRLGTATLRIGGTEEPLATALIRYTAPFNLAGLPALTVPVRTSGPLPVGLQLVAPPLEDHLVCFVAAAYEQARDAVRPYPRPPVAATAA